MAVLLWSGNAVVSKASSALFTAAEMSLLRWVGASLILLPLAWTAMNRQRAAVIARLPRTIVLGLLGCALFPYLMYLAAGFTSAIHLGLLQTLMPVLAVVLARVLFAAPITPVMVLGTSVSLLGVVVVLSDGDPLALLEQAPNRGDILMLAATACFALYSVLLGRWKGEVTPAVDLLGQSSVAAIAMLPVWWFSADHTAQAAGNAQGWWLVAYAAAFASIAAPLLWIGGIARIGPARAAVFFNLLPIFTAGLAIALLGEMLTLPLVLGGLLTIVGVVVAQRGSAA